MSVENLSIDVLIKEVRALAREYPNAWYTSPLHEGSYFQGMVKDGPPGQYGCLIGQAFQRLGKPVNYGPTIKCVLVQTGVEQPSGEWSREADWLDKVQGLQDQKKAWSTCLKIADELIPLS